MRALEIAIGQRFGRLEVVHIERHKGYRKAIVKCDCGRTRNVRPNHLVSGKTQSCGCYARDINSSHGMSRTKIYQRWRSMINRCRYPSDQNYQYYGGRGIKVCKRWIEFENFAADMGLPANDALELDRIDVNGNYEPGNVRWVNHSQQMRNRRRNAAKRSDSTNRYRGVVRKSANRWGALIVIDRVRYWLGSFKTEEEAAQAYDARARLHGFPLNFPKGEN